MRLRPVLLSVLAVGLVAATPAISATKVCNLLVDVTGDGGSSVVVRAPALDITGADIATTKNEVIGIVRLVTTDVSSDPFSPLRYGWKLAFKISGQDIRFDFQRIGGPFAQDSAGASVNDQYAEAKTKVTKDSITWRVARKHFAGTLVKKPGKLYLEQVYATSWFNGASRDSANGTNVKYKDFTPSCLT